MIAILVENNPNDANDLHISKHYEGQAASVFAEMTCGVACVVVDIFDDLQRRRERNEEALKSLAGSLCEALRNAIVEEMQTRHGGSSANEAHRMRGNRKRVIQ